VARPSILAIMLAANRNGLQLKYTRNADGSEVLEPFTLTAGQLSPPMPDHETQTLANDFQGLINRAQRRS
jgi:hypothetical protein